MILGQGMVLATAGIGFGIVGALLLPRSMESVLFGIERRTLGRPAGVRDPLGVAALASWLPARRALSIDLVIALAPMRTNDTARTTSRTSRRLGSTAPSPFSVAERAPSDTGSRS